MTVLPGRRRFSVDEYYEMARAGILGEDDRVELIEGEIVEMSPIARRHAAYVARLTECFVQQFAEQAIVWIQNPVRLNELTEPEPDVALLHSRTDYYASGHPTPEDVSLIVEVADTSSRFDRLVKMPLYAGSGIPEYWLVDLDEDAVIVYCDPQPAGYGSVHVVQRGERLAPLALPGLELAAEDILG